jgi:1,4-alpha-glucan branching enzyme
MAIELHADAINAIVYGDHGAPFDVLGKHAIDAKTTLVRAFRPTAAELTLIDKSTSKSKKYAMERVHDLGLFEVTIKRASDKLRYVLEESNDTGTFTFEDPYTFEPMLGDLDLHLHGEGRHLNAYEVMGAHYREIELNDVTVTGVNFAVWAPNARRVSVIGDFNNWDGRIHPMRSRGGNGIWELFIPNITYGERYKYEVKSQHRGYIAEKVDPYGFYAERRPNTASIVADVNGYKWGDDAWMKARAEKSALEQPMSVYEVHLGSWRRNERGEWLTYRELSSVLIDYAKEMNFTHLELMPVAEHPLDASWGYQVTGYYAPTSRYGTPEDFMYFVDQCHQAGIGVILDWVPAHFPKDGHALSFFDGTHLYSHEDSRKGEHPDWGTYIFNYGRNEVRNFLLANAMFWLKKYHIDGLRVDAVSSMLYLDFSREDGQWIPNEYGSNENLDAISFIKEANEVVHSEAPGAITIAEESTAWAMVSRPTYIGGLGFTLKWNMGWMHDTLDYFQKDPIYRRYHHNQMTFSMIYAFNENFVLSLSHDEVVHGKGSLMGKMPGDWWQKFANLRLIWGYQYAHPGKKLNFMGSEIGQWTEWNEDTSLDWHLLTMPTHQKLQSWIRDLNKMYKEEPALYEVDFSEDGFRWIEANDADNSVFSFVRYAKDRREFVIAVSNFTPVPRENYRVGVPEAGYYAEILNSDSDHYGGGNVGNEGGVHSDAVAWQNFDQSINITVPPLAIVFFKLQA